MVTIRKGRDVLTLVNVFTVKAENQLLWEVSESVTASE